MPNKKNITGENEIHQEELCTTVAAHNLFVHYLQYHDLYFILECIFKLTKHSINWQGEFDGAII